MTDKTEHLNMIQNVITRMANNSLQIKCWTIAITTAFIALANDWVISISLVPIVLFCFLDAYYLQLEKSFRNLFDNIRIKSETEIEYSMDYKPFKEKYSTSLFTRSIIPFYIILAITVIAVSSFRIVN